MCFAVCDMSSSPLVARLFRWPSLLTLGCGRPVKKCHYFWGQQLRGRQGHGPDGEHGRKRGQYFGLHMIAVDSKGNIYTGEVFAGELVQRFVPVK